MGEEKKVTELVSREAFEQTFMEFQESWRKELRKEILNATKTHTGLYKQGMKHAANIVWNVTEVEEEVTP